MKSYPMPRFWAKVEQPLEFNKCWHWRGAKIGPGYGSFAPIREKKVYAHRFLYEQLIGPIPQGLVIDHLCRNPNCVNPFHLQPITNKENVLRGVGLTAQNAKKQYCAKGHELSGANLCQDFLKHGMRLCRVCRNEKARERYNARIQKERLLALKSDGTSDWSMLAPTEADLRIECDQSDIQREGEDST